MKHILSFLLFAVFFSSFAQKFRSIDVKVDSSSFGINNQLELKIALTKKNGKVLKFEKANPKSKWNKIYVSANFMASFYQGMITYKLSETSAKHHTLNLKVSDKKWLVSKDIQIELPYVKQITFHADTLIVNQACDFTYDLLFSNGKTHAGNGNLFNLDNLVAESNYAVSIQNDKLWVETSVPIPGKIPVKFRHRESGIILAEKEFYIKYPASVYFDFSANQGMDGSPGQNGVNYSDNGTHGQPGTSGENAPLVKVFITEHWRGEQRLLAFTVFSSDNRRSYGIIEFKGNKIPIIAKGGNGGSGGKGGDGHSGLIDKEKKIDSPYGGAAGNGGNAGSGGNGGKVVVCIDSALAWLKEYLLINTDGGRSGVPGKEGTPGSGDYENSKLLGILLSTKRGALGTAGQNGIPGYNGNGGEVIYLKKEEFGAEFKNCSMGKF
ncbi:MAG TPA: hypothetical protein VGF30_02760 [Bacteroidia bacterium]